MQSHHKGLFYTIPIYLYNFDIKEDMKLMLYLNIFSEPSSIKNRLFSRIDGGLYPPPNPYHRREHSKALMQFILVMEN